MKSLNKKTIYVIIAIVVAASVVVEAMFAHPHGHNWWHTMPGADILDGLYRWLGTDSVCKTDF